MLFESLGLIVLYILALRSSLWSTMWAMVPIFVLRLAASEACVPLINSMLMDFVPKVPARILRV